MNRNYEIWDFSLIDSLKLLVGAMLAGGSIGWLFYDSLKIGFGLGVLFYLIIRPRYRSWQIERRKAILLLQFRDVLYAVSSAVTVGRSMAQALEEAADFWRGTYSEKDMIMEELSAMSEQIKEGNARELDVMRDFAQRSGLPDISDFVMVYENCRGSGADLRKAIDRAAAIIGDRIDLERELNALMAQKKFEGRIIMSSPFIMVLFLKLTSPEFLEPLTTTSMGRITATAALCMVGAAAWMIERMNHVEF